MTAKMKKPSGGKPLDKISQAQAVVRSAERYFTFFHDQCKEPFADLREDGQCINLPLNSKMFKILLAHKIYGLIGKVLSSRALSEGGVVLEGKALKEGPQVYLSKRTAWCGGALYYDLCDPSGRAIKVIENDWGIVENPPTLFRRYQHQLPQVEPSFEGNIMKILPFLGIKKGDKERQCLELCDLVCRMIPGYPQPIRVVYGPQGSIKTTKERIKKLLVDPSATDVSTLNPYKLESVAHQISQEWITVFDNCTRVTEETSNLLCRASTGGTFHKRKLYSDHDSIILDLNSVVVITGVNIPIDKPDIMDRAILFNHERIAPPDRVEEKVIIERFKEVRSEIVGGLFDVLAKTLQIKPKIKQKNLPRMADYCLWGMAAAESLGFGANMFLNAYRRNIHKQNEQIITSSPLATVLIDLLSDHGEFSGTSTTLFEVLTKRRQALGISENVLGWPQAPNALTPKLNELRSNLQEFGYEVRTGGRSKDSRQIAIYKDRDHKNNDTTE